MTKFLFKNGKLNHKRIIYTCIVGHIIALILLALPNLFKTKIPPARLKKEMSVSLKNLTPAPPVKSPEQTKTKSKPKPKAKSKTKTKPKAKPKAKPKTKTKSSHQAKPSSKAKTSNYKKPAQSASQQSALINSYLGGVDQILMSNWIKPSFSEITYQDSVIIELKIHRTGKILSKKITKRSKDAATNTSATRLLQKISRLPPFPTSYSQDIITEQFELQITL